MLAGYPVVAGYRLEKGNHLAERVPKGYRTLEGNETEPSAESILAQDPDLLVVGEEWWQYYKERKLLTQDIAPVLVVGGGFSPHWRRHTEQQLTRLGRAPRAKKQLDAYDTRLAAARQEVGRLLKGRKIAVSRRPEAPVLGPDQQLLPGCRTGPRHGTHVLRPRA